MKWFPLRKRTLADEIEELKALRSGSEQAHLAFIRRVWDSVLSGLTHRLGGYPNFQLIKEDAFQEGWITFRQKVLQNPSFVPERVNALEAYLFSCSLGHAQNMLKKARPLLPREIDYFLAREAKRSAAEEEAFLPNPMDPYSRKDEADRLKQAINSLGELCRKILTMFYFEQKSQQEIGKKLNQETKQIKRKKHTCMQALKQKLGLQKPNSR